MLVLRAREIPRCARIPPPHAAGCEARASSAATSRRTEASTASLRGGASASAGGSRDASLACSGKKRSTTDSGVAIPSGRDRTAANAARAGVFHGGRLYALGGSPFRYQDDVPTQDPPDQSAADDLPLGGGAWVHSKERNTKWERMSAGVDALGRLIGYGPVKAFLCDPVLGHETEPASPDQPLSFANFAAATDAQHRLYAIGGGPS